MKRITEHPRWPESLRLQQEWQATYDAAQKAKAVEYSAYKAMMELDNILSEWLNSPDEAPPQNPEGD